MRSPRTNFLFFLFGFRAAITALIQQHQLHAYRGSGCHASSNHCSLVLIDPSSMVGRTIYTLYALTFLRSMLNSSIVPSPLSNSRISSHLLQFRLSRSYLLICLLPMMTSRELQMPQGYSPEPVTGSATCIIENMRGMPLLFGGLVVDPDGLAEPTVNGGCEDTLCTTGSVYMFDKPAHGWETIQVISSPYPEGRAGHTMTGKNTGLTCTMCNLNPPSYILLPLNS
jgi:hypothetical protein